LSLEQVDRMMEESTPRTSAKWVPHETFASAVLGDGEKISTGQIDDIEKRGSVY